MDRHLKDWNNFHSATSVCVCRNQARTQGGGNPLDPKKLFFGGVGFLWGVKAPPPPLFDPKTIFGDVRWVPYSMSGKIDPIFFRKGKKKKKSIGWAERGGGGALMFFRPGTASIMQC